MKNYSNALVLFSGTLTKLNSIPISLKNRPRIPTPDVTKEVVDREQRLALSAYNAASIGAGVVGMIPSNGQYPTDIPVVVLSPIQETEGQTSPGKTGTAALAQAVLSPTLRSAGLVTPMTLTPVTVSQLSQLGFVTTTSASTPRTFNNNNNSASINTISNEVQAVITEVNTSEEEGSGSSRSGSINGQEDRSTPLIGQGRATPVIGERVSPIGSHGNSPNLEAFSDRSPILMSPDRLSGYIVTTGTATPDSIILESRGRRSASLPGPPPLELQDDRSSSLPHSPGLKHRENRAISVVTRYPDITANLQQPTEASRKLSTIPSSSTTTTPPSLISGSKRSEVYV